MMGGAVSTSQYFPLVDGARYDYTYTSGPWATSTAVMHAGQTWAGVTGLTAMHTTYVCNAGVTCAPDATDFFRMDPDGMRYFGGTGANAAGTQFSMMTYTNPEWLLKNPGDSRDDDGLTAAIGTWKCGKRASRARKHDGRTEPHEQLSGAGAGNRDDTGRHVANALHVREQRGSAMSATSGTRRASAW